MVRIAGASRHPNSLANLEKRPAPPIGNRLSHGFTSERLVRDVNAGVGEIMDALAEAAPVREGDGSLPAADVVAVEVAARALKRYRSVSGWCDLHGRLDDKGEVRPAARHEVTAENQLHRVLDNLGCLDGLLEARAEHRSHGWRLRPRPALAGGRR